MCSGWWVKSKLILHRSAEKANLWNLSQECYIEGRRLYYTQQEPNQQSAILFHRQTEKIGQAVNLFQFSPGLFMVHIPTVGKSPPPMLPSLKRACKALPICNLRCATSS